LSKNGILLKNNGLWHGLPKFFKSTGLKNNNSNRFHHTMYAAALKSVRRSVGNMGKRTTSLARKVGKSVAPYLGGAAKAATEAAAKSQAKNVHLSRALQHARERASLAERQVKAADAAADAAIQLAAEQAAKTGNLIRYHSYSGIIDVQPCSPDAAEHYIRQMVTEKTGEEKVFDFTGSVVINHDFDDITIWAAWCSGTVFLNADMFARNGYTRFCVNPTVFDE
jgi:hypothetical protein